MLQQPLGVTERQQIHAQEHAISVARKVVPQVVAPPVTVVEIGAQIGWRIKLPTGMKRLRLRQKKRKVRRVVFKAFGILEQAIPRCKQFRND